VRPVSALMFSLPKVRYIIYVNALSHMPVKVVLPKAVATVPTSGPVVLPV
jgi:hypothetical protein